ncbi:MAG: prolipoprotein diacylglyceryl transferase [Limnobacter sp.]|nr:prolipoprotein diacylglyceryl transferase [Limnobacter sp.]
MFVHPQFDPIALSIGPFALHWYGLMYLLGFLAFVVLSRRRLPLFPAITRQDIDNLLTWGVVGVILGGRLGYVLFYKPDYYWAHPTEILAIWEGGMSFHGGFLGVLAAGWLYCRSKGFHFLDLMDFIAPTIPVGLAFGRLGNFINGELWGRPTDGPWGVVFPQAGDNFVRHPSQLYEMALEGVVLFVVLWWFASQPRKRGQVSALFLLGYGVARFVVELAREPDRFLGSLALGMSMGQWLCVPMLLGAALLWWLSQSKPAALQSQRKTPAETPVKN